MSEIPDSVRIPDMQRFGSRVYCQDMDADQQKWLIDRLGMLVDIQADGVSMKQRVRVKSVKDDKAILEVV